MIMGDYTGSLEERMENLYADLAGKKNLILVGSSYGGLMAAIFACRREPLVRRLILLAPALVHGDFNARFGKPVRIPVVLYHGQLDDVVPPEPTQRIAERLFSRLEHHLVEDDHNLHRIFPLLDWNALLEIEG